MHDLTHHEMVHNPIAVESLVASSNNTGAERCAAELLERTLRLSWLQSAAAASGRVPEHAGVCRRLTFEICC